MTATYAPPATDRAHRRSAAVVAAAVAVVVLTIAAIVVLGYVPLEGYPSAADAPVAARTGTVAVVYTTPDVGECVHLVAAADGAAGTIHCDASRLGSPSVPAWSVDGDLLLVGRDRLAGTAALGRVVDRSTGERGATVEVLDVPPMSWPASVAAHPGGARARVESWEGTAGLVVTDADGDSRTLLETTGPRDYRFDGVVWSPDARWLLVVDSRGRLLVADAVGQEPTQVIVALGRDRWVEAVPAWQQPGELVGRVRVSWPDQRG